MIHHVSIPARDPAKVARVLAELTGWKVRPFLGPVADGFIVMSEDENGSAIEIYPDDVVMFPGEGDVPSQFTREAAPSRMPFHLLLSVDGDVAAIERIGAREGWRTLHCWRGPPDRPVFELVEFWVENRVLIEVATRDMLPNYIEAHTARAHDQALAQMQSATARG